MQPDFAENIVVGFGRLAGRSVGVVANQPAFLAGVLDNDASTKAARFVRTCDAFNVPLLVLEDAHVTLGNTLRFLDEHILREGDYLVVEDTVDEAKRNELGEFLAGTPEGRYAVDTHLTDYFGENVCWNVNAYLRRMK